MANFFESDFLDDLKNRCDIVDVISRYVPLKKAGREFSGCCPFHHERTPSFMIYPGSQSYHCFGCKESGDVIKFVQKYENLSFVESVTMLANMVNLPLPQFKDVDQDVIAKKRKEKALILQALKDVAKYYHTNLYSNAPQAIKAIDYIAKRRISPEFVRKFGLGCSIDYYSALKFLHSKGYSNDILAKAGLISQADDKEFDPFGRRLTFPIIDKDGNVIGFSARLLDDKDSAKYKNSSASNVFNKSEVIFGINMLKKVVEQNRQENKNLSGLPYIVIVEGQIDVIMMHQFGFNSTVACLGTALTPMHIRRLKQFSDNVILMLDSDGAGQKATLRSIDVLRSGGIITRVASIPNDKAKDPDEFLNAYGAEEMQKILDSAIDGIEFKIKVLAQKYNLNDLVQKSKFVREALIVIKGIENIAEQDIYLSLVFKYSGTPVDVLRIDLERVTVSDKPFWDREETLNIPTPQLDVPKDAYTQADIFVIASILYDKDYIKPFIERFDELEFYGDLVEAKNYIKSAFQNNRKPSISGIFSEIDIENAGDVVKSAVNYEFLPDAYPELTFESCWLRNVERKLKVELETLQKTIATSSSLTAEQKEILQKCYIIRQDLEKIKLELQRISSKYTSLVNNTSKKTNKSEEA